MTTNNIAIDVKNITKTYKLYNKPLDRLKESLHPFKKQYHHEFFALNDISFQVKKGETVGILGKNGAGKSTLLKIITGVLTPTSGSVTVNGKIASLLELGAGFNPEYTGLENIYFQGALMGFSREEMARKVEAILTFADIGEFIHQPVKMYSSGMFARLAFAVSINVEPDVLIVDEALSVGDAGFQLKCALKMAELKKNGVTILFVSHSTQSILSLCNVGIIINAGILIEYSTDIISVTNNYQELTRNSANIPLIEEKNSAVAITNNEPSVQSITEKSYASELGDINEHRFGNFSAKIYDTLFFNVQDESLTLFQSGSVIRMQTFIHSAHDLPNLVLGYSFRNQNGIDIFGDNTYLCDHELHLLPGITMIENKFRLNVPRGEYFLHIGLATLSQERKEIDQRWPFRKITVFSDREVVGFSYCPSTVTIENNYGTLT